MPKEEGIAMPTYQYRCESCFTFLERRQSFDEKPLAECPTCGGELRRVLNPANLIFKGSGWYCTDKKTDSEPIKPSACGNCEKEPACAATKS